MQKNTNKTLIIKLNTLKNKEGEVKRNDCKSSEQIQGSSCENHDFGTCSTNEFICYYNPRFIDIMFKH